MSVSNELTRIQNDKSTLRDWTVAVGLTDSTANLDTIAEAISGIENKGSIAAQVKEGEVYTIPKGYHSGSGTVTGIAGDGSDITLQAKTVTPTKTQQSVTPDSPYGGLSSVTVEAIPSNYQDVSVTTATADKVLANSTFVDATGTTTAGTMLNNGQITATIDGTTTTTYSIPSGYTSGGTVSLTDDIENALKAI